MDSYTILEVYDTDRQDLDDFTEHYVLHESYLLSRKKCQKMTMPFISVQSMNLL